MPFYFSRNCGATFNCQNAKPLDTHMDKMRKPLHMHEQVNEKAKATGTKYLHDLVLKIARKSERVRHSTYRIALSGISELWR